MNNLNDLDQAATQPAAGPGTPDAAPQPKAATMTVPVPLEALAEPDDKEEMVNPEQGDIVEFQVEGRIVSVNGGTAMVQPTAVNGKPLDAGQDQEQEPGPEDQDAADYAELEGQAKAQDETNQ